MHFILQVGQRFRVPSIISWGLSKRHGQFMMVIEISQLYRLSGSPLQPPNGDILFNLVEYPGAHGYPMWFDCHCLITGNENKMAPGMNYSTNIITHNGEWFLPDLFRKQALFMDLLAAGVVTFLPECNELNPAPNFNLDVLRYLLDRGATQFVRQSYPAGMATDIKESFLITAYHSIAQANEHFQVIRYDQRKYVYNRSRREDMEKLYLAAKLIEASPPSDYRVYCAHLPYERLTLSPRMKHQVDRYTSCNSPWKQSGGYKSAKVTLRFGELGVSLTGPDGFIPWDVLTRF